MRCPRCPIARVAVRKPHPASCRMMISRMEYRSPIGTNGFGSKVVYGRSRTPLPPARMTACMADPFARRGGRVQDGSAGIGARAVTSQVGRVVEPVDGHLEPVGQVVSRLPPGGLAQLGAVTDQPHHLGRLGAQAIAV